MKNYTLILLIFAIIATTNSPVNAQRITVTIAGNGLAGYTGDGGPGKQARISGAQYLCSDLAGNIYFVDGARIRKVSATTGIITTIGGGGSSTADGIAATSALLSPQSICANSIGDVFLVTGSKIKKIDAATNIITTYAGTGSSGYAGDGGPATAAQFNGIYGICADGLGNIFAVDGGNNRIRKIAAATKTITTFAGTGASSYTGDGGLAITASLSNPNLICSNPIGDIYFTDQSGQYIRRVNGMTGIISTYAGGGGSIVGDLAMHTLLGPASGIAFDANYNLCFNETSCSCRRIDHFTDSVNYIGGNFANESFKDDTNSLYAWMNTQYGLTTDSKDNIYIADYGNLRIRKMVKLTNAPTFAYGDLQSINPCPGYAFSLNTQMAIADLDLGQTETLTVTTAPVHGVLAGFPATVTSNGNFKLATPSGLSYTVSSSYTGADSFRVRVFDGTASDTVTIYVAAQMASPAIVSGLPKVCTGQMAYLSGSVPGGIWSATNPTATVDPSTGTVSGVTAGIDTIIYNMLVPCPLTTSVAVTVNPTPAVGTISGNDTICVGASIHLTETVSGGTWSSDDPFYASVGATTGTVTGNYYSPNVPTSISYTVSNATCTDMAVKQMYVNAVTSPISVSNPLCVGSSTYGYESVPGGTWSTTNSHVSVTIMSSYPFTTGVTTGVDTIIYTNTNGCGTGTAMQAVSVITTPFAGTISGPSDVCVGGSITFSSSVAGGTWDTKYFNAYTASYSVGVVTGLTAGTDTVLYTVGTYGCESVASAFIKISKTPVAGTVTGATSVCAGATISLTDAAAGGTWNVANAMASVSGSGVVSGITAGSDSIFYIVNNACGKATAAQVVTINPLPVAGTISGPASVCAGAAISLSNAAGGGSWTVTNANASVSGSGVVSGNIAGGDSILYAVTNTCGTVTTAKVITINAMPTAGTITGLTSVCTGATITLSNGSSGGAWSMTNTKATVSTSGTVSGIAAGNDSVLYAVSNICGTATTAQVITINPTPVAGTITGLASVCTGATITLSNGSSGGAWSVTNTKAAVSASGMVSGVTAGSDSVLYTVSNICGTAKTTKAITINSMPVAGTITGLTSVCAGATISLSNGSAGGAWSVTNAKASVSGSGVVSGIAAGGDSVLYAVSNMCGTATTTKVITINPMPVAGTITGLTSVCTGSTISLSNSSSGGMWSVTNTKAAVSASGMVSGIIAGSDSVLYAVSNMCGTATVTKAITINPLPVAGAITGLTSVCAGSKITLSDGSTGGMWTVTNAKATVSVSGMVSGIAAGSDSVLYAVSNMCGTATTTKVITINPLPVAGTITGLTSVCSGATISLSNGTSGGAWSVTNTRATVSVSGMVSGITAGGDSVLYAVSNMCGTATTTKVVTINPLPVAGTIAGLTSVCAGSKITLSNGSAGGIWTVTNAKATVSGSGVVSGVTAGNDSVLYAVSNMCGTATTTKEIIINPLPVAATITGLTSVCAGSTISLSDGGSGGVWSVTNTRAAVSVSGMVSGITAGNDSVLYAVSNMCGTATTTKVVTINPMPVAGTITGLTGVCTGSRITLSDGSAGGMWTVTNAKATVSVSGVVSGVTAGGDSVLYAVSNMCGTATAVKEIVINPMPVAGTIAGPASVCAGATVSLTDAAPGGVWSATNANAAISGAGAVSGIAAGSDSLLYTVTNMCGTAIAASVVDINPLPDAGTITGETSVCAGTSISLTDGAAGGVWSVSNANAAVSTSGTVDGLSQGTDTIVYSMTNICGTATSSYSIQINDCHLAVNHAQSMISGINIFPNPTSSILNIGWTALRTGRADVVLTDYVGRVVLRDELIDNGTNSKQLNLSNLMEGVYMLKIESGSDYYTYKIVINK